MTRIVGLAVVALTALAPLLAQDLPIGPSQRFPKPDFVLRDPNFKVEKARTVIKGDGQNGATFAVYGGTDMVQVSSLSFSADGKLLAVGSLPNLVDVWDTDKRRIVRHSPGGTQVALSADGTKLAKDVEGITIVDVLTGTTLLKIPRTGGFVKRLSFDPEGKRLLVSANGDDDKVFDVTDGHLLAELLNTQEGQFSRDGSLVVGGNAKHLITWATTDWTKRQDLPGGPDYVVTMAADIEKDLVLVGGPNTARLLKLSSGEEIAKVGQGYTNFAAFNQPGTLVLDYAGKGFGVWSSDGKKYCLEPNLGSNVVALSPNDEWVAMATGDKETAVMLWKLSTITAACGVASLGDKSSSLTKAETAGELSEGVAHTRMRSSRILGDYLSHWG